MNAELHLLLERLDKVTSRGGDRWMARCPGHDDKHPSLSIRLSETGKIQLLCYAGCDWRKILTAIGLSGAALYPPDHHRGDRSPHASTRHARARAELARHEHEAMMHAARARVALQAQQRWHDLPAANPDHPYLQRKGIIPAGLRQEGLRLVAPLVDGRHIVNLQTIGPDGQKRYLKDGRKQGCYCPFGRLEDRLLVCEGIATAITLYQCSGHAVAAAMDCGNLVSAARCLRERYPTTPMIIMADNDADQPDNPGVTHAKAAAEAVHGVWLAPAQAGQDWNDLFLAEPWYFEELTDERI